jgi:membrane protein YdbS with pleckstrin-like domain
LIWLATKIQRAGEDMFCNKCGQTVPEGSRFCNSCGTQTIAPVAVQDGAALTDDPGEKVMFTLRPTMIFVVVRYVIAALVVIAAAALMGLLASRVSGQVAFLVILGVGLLSFANPIYHHIQRKREVYTLTNHKLEMRYGIIAKTMRNIPLRNIQDVTVTASVWQRFLNLGDIEIDSASEAGKIILDDIHHPDRYTNMILAQLRRRN